MIKYSDTGYWVNFGSMWVERLRRWINIELTLSQRFMFSEDKSATW